MLSAIQQHLWARSGNGLFTIQICSPRASNFVRQRGRQLTLAASMLGDISMGAHQSSCCHSCLRGVSRGNAELTSPPGRRPSRTTDKDPNHPQIQTPRTKTSQLDACLTKANALAAVVKLMLTDEQMLPKVISFTI